MNKLLVALLALCLSRALACAPNEGAKVTIGESTYVCVVINFKSYMVAVPKADDYSRVAVSGSYNNKETFGPGQNRTVCEDTNHYNQGTAASSGLCQYTTVHVESHGVKSLVKAYKVTPALTTLPAYVFPVMTVVIHVYNGDVQTLTWDDGCHFCDSLSNSADGTNEVCQPNVFSTPNASAVSATTTAASLTKPYSLDQLKAAKVDGYGQSCITYGEGYGVNAGGVDCGKNGGADCDMKLYVVWTGTDVNGQYFQSAGLRFSRFQQFAISSLYVSARSLSLEVYDGAKDAATSVSDATTNAADTVAARL